MCVDNEKLCDAANTAGWMYSGSSDDCTSTAFYKETHGMLC